MGEKLSVEEIIKHNLDDIKLSDMIILKWLYEGRDISNLKLEIATRHSRICYLKYYCKENNLKFEDYYTDRLSKSLPRYSMQQALRDL
ncbi:hypothetical protein [Clostridium culturomicium]|uniref:hypothetical protein n=1 Tax=Clostridium culturomicium TaxID=1499683 RepID=UPI0005915D5D|nr:hypothetical protein [Clostridium culturomicium]